MSRGQVDIAQLDFSAGMTRDSAPHRIDDRACWDHVNGFYDEDGSAIKRGGTVAKTAAAFGTSGRWIWSGEFEAGARTVFASTDDFGVLGSDDATVVNLNDAGLTGPASAAFLEGMLFIGGGWIYGGSRMTANYSTGTVAVTEDSKTVTGTGTAFLANVDEGALFKISSGRLYVVADVVSDTVLTLRDPYEGSTDSGLAYGAYRIYRIGQTTDPYIDSEHYATVGNRLIAVVDGHSIAASEPQKPHDQTATIVGGSPSEVPTIHESPEAVVIRGLSSIGNTLLVHTSGGTWTVEGLEFNIVDSYGTPQHRVRVLSRDMVIWGSAGIASWQQALILPCLDGIFMVDGISGPEPVSHPIDELYKDYVRRGYRPGGATVHRGHYLLPILSASGDRVRDLLVCRLDRTIVDAQGTHPWSRFVGRGGRLSALATRVPRAPDEPVLLGIENDATARVVDCTGYFTPDATNTLDVDEAVAWELVSRDFETGQLTANVVRHLRSRYELIGDGSVIDFDYGFGVREQSGFDWDEWDWADAVDAETDLIWSGDDEDLYYALECPGGESRGADVHRCRVNERCRYIRLRARNADECSALRLRSLELLIRPSRAVRR